MMSLDQLKGDEWADRKDPTPPLFMHDVELAAHTVRGQGVVLRPACQKGKRQAVVLGLAESIHKTEERIITDEASWTPRPVKSMPPELEAAADALSRQSASWHKLNVSQLSKSLLSARSTSSRTSSIVSDTLSSRSTLPSPQPPSSPDCVTRLALTAAGAIDGEMDAATPVPPQRSVEQRPPAAPALAPSESAVAIAPPAPLTSEPTASPQCELCGDLEYLLVPCATQQHWARCGGEMSSRGMPLFDIIPLLCACRASMELPREAALYSC